MSTPTVEEGQFDDAPDHMHPEGVRQGHNDIDETPIEQIEDSSGDNDVYSESEDSDDDLRVEDEDWEIAERGTCLDPSPLYFSFDISS